MLIEFASVFPQVVLEEEKGGEMNRVPLKITGISDNGYMTAVDSKGDIFELHPDGNRCIPSLQSLYNAWLYCDLSNHIHARSH
jgi:hypothetical protein